MEEIRFVRTPPCRLCTGSREQKRRYPCLGCQKQAAPAQKTSSGGRLRRIGQRQRDAAVAALRREGLSFGEIARLLCLPRSTVFNAAKRNAPADENTSNSGIQKD